MPTYQKEQDPSPTLFQQDVQTDRAKDKAYMDYREKANEVADTLEAKGITLENMSAFDHQSRRDVLRENM
jgi:hypothetical protein